jgi:molybdopterin converting factor small subunit
VKVQIPGALLSYTGTGLVDADGATLAELFEDLERRYPGLRFRVIDEQDRFRPNMRCFVNGRQSFDLDHPLGGMDEIMLIQALRGG